VQPDPRRDGQPQSSHDGHSAPLSGTAPSSCTFKISARHHRFLVTAVAELLRREEQATLADFGLAFVQGVAIA
jgi:hypothetical protein